MLSDFWTKDPTKCEKYPNWELEAGLRSGKQNSPSAPANVSSGATTGRLWQGQLA